MDISANDGLPQPHISPWTILEAALKLFDADFALAREQPEGQIRAEIIERNRNAIS